MSELLIMSPVEKMARAIASLDNENEKLRTENSQWLKAANMQKDAINQLRSEIDRLDVENERMEAGLRKIEAWTKAYPLTIFPEPDFKKARKLLEAGGITLDAVSASNMRHVINGVAKFVSDALGESEPKP